MSFYLLKSTYRRDRVGDVLIDLSKVESIGVAMKEFEDTETKIYAIKVVMDSMDDYKALYKTKEEAKQAIREILRGNISEQDLNELHF